MFSPLAANRPNGLRISAHLYVLFAAGFAALACLTGAAQADTFRIVYDARALGIGIGSIESKITIDETSYSIFGQVRTVGLAAVFAKFRGDVLAEGVVTRKGNLVPIRNRSDQTRRDERQKVNFTYKRGNIVSAKLDPPRETNSERVPITDAHLKQARDPAVALIVTVPKGQQDDMKAVCNQTLRIFDANERYDLKLSYKLAGGHRPSGFRGPVATCRVRYIPVSGHGRNSKDTARYANNRTMEVSLARIGDTNAFITSELALKTRFGRVSVKAR